MLIGASLYAINKVGLSAQHFRKGGIVPGRRCTNNYALFRSDSLVVQTPRPMHRHLARRKNWKNIAHRVKGKFSKPRLLTRQGRDALASLPMICFLARLTILTITVPRCHHACGCFFQCFVSVFLFLFFL